MGLLDDREERCDEWEGVVVRVSVQERVEAVPDELTGTAPVQEWTEAILYCRRDDGTEEEYELDVDDADCKALLSLAPGARILKEAGQQLPTAIRI